MAMLYEQDVRTACGVMFEVVMGIPKSEGMRPPPKIPANPSFVELDEDENAVEKFKKAMGNISSILSLDRLKQVTTTTPLSSLPLYFSPSSLAFSLPPPLPSLSPLRDIPCMFYPHTGGCIEGEVDH